MKHVPVLPTLILTALAAGTLWSSALAEEPPRPRSLATAAALFPFDAYAKHREAIGLSEEQMREVGRIAEGTADAARKLEGERRERTEALQELLAQRPVDLEKAMQRFQAVLAVENEMKALQFRGGVAAQNLLSPEQAAKVQAIAAKTQGTRDGSDLGNIREKLEQLKGELRKRGGGELSKENVGTLEHVEQAAQQGKLDEVRKQMEGLLAQLGRQGEARKGKEPGGNAQPSLADLQNQASQVKARLAETTDPAQREQLEQQLAKFHAMQERISAADHPEKGAIKGDGDKGKQPDRPEKSPVKGEGDAKEKGGSKGDGAVKEKGGIKGEGEVKEKGKFDKDAGNAKRLDPELRQRVEGALAAFQEAKAAGNREGMEKVTKSIEALLRDSARDGDSFKNGGPKDGERKDGAIKDGARKDGAPKGGERKEGAPKEGAAKE